MSHLSMTMNSIVHVICSQHTAASTHQSMLARKTRIGSEVNSLTD